MKQFASARAELSESEVGATQASRIYEFSMFVTTNSHLLMDTNVNVLALAYNQSSSGSVAASVNVASESKPDLWIRRLNRPASNPDKPISLRILRSAAAKLLLWIYGAFFL